ncbi:MAG: hypothetical protein O3A01_07615, partial [bacterium]|nr:hypothetical protein [bacterium]
FGFLGEAISRCHRQIKGNAFDKNSPLYSSSRRYPIQLRQTTIQNNPASTKNKYPIPDTDT